MGRRCQVCGCVNEEGEEYCADCGVKLDGQLPAGALTIEAGAGEAVAGGDTDGTVSAVTPPDGEPDGAEATEATEAPTKEPADSGREEASGGGEAGAPVCPACGSEVPSDGRFCHRCGAETGPAGDGPGGPADRDGFCPECRRPVGPADSFCNACGAALDGSAGPGRRSTVKSPERGPVDVADAVFTLTVVTGHDKDRVFAIPGDSARLGRSPDNDVVLDTDGYVSSSHSRIFREDGVFWVEDLGSTNGTFIKVRGRHRLETGDQVKIGQSIFRFDSRQD